MLFGLNTSDPARISATPGWGYDFVEIGARAVAPFEPDAAWHPRRRMLEDTGVPITHLAGFIPAEARFVGPDIDWGKVRDYLETCVGRAAEVGVRVFNWGSPASRSVPTGWSYARAFEQIERAGHMLADALAPVDAACGIEPINPRECTIIYYLTDAIGVATSIKRPQVRILADFFHMALQNEPMEHMSLARDWLVHVHTSGPDRHFPKADDPWDHAGFLRVLRQAGYDHTLSFECSRIPEGAMYEVEARAGIAYMRRLYDQVKREEPAAGPEA